MPKLHEEPLPGFVAPADVVTSAFSALRPPRRVSVSEWAEAERQLRNPGAYSGPWRNAMAPYLVEPMDRTQSRAVETLVMVGGSQFGKTTLGENMIGHAAVCQPRDVLVVQYSRDMAIEFCDERIGQKLIRVTPSLTRLLGGSRRDDKGLGKRFINGMRVMVGWPVPGQLASRPVPIAWIDERDRMPNDVGGEGDPVELARKRTTTFKRNGLVLVTSTPAGLHPDDVGPDSEDASPVLVLFFEGDRNLWHWQCLDCREYWTPGFDFNRRPTTAHLHIPEGATPEEARDQAVLVCPHCGGVVGEREKEIMNATALWLPDGLTVSPDGEINGARPMTRTVSYWFCGLASPFMTIGKVAQELVTAERHYARTQDESKLKTCFNTAFGFPYRPRAGGALPVEIEALERRRERYRLGTVPKGPRFLTASVDVGKRKFDVKVEGWNEEAESWLIDRYTITHLPDGSEVDPANLAVHWELLTKKVLNAAYPLADDPTRELSVAGLAIDTGGAAGQDEEGLPTEGVNLQARNYARRLFASGVERWRVMLVKGAAQRTAPMLRNPTWEVDDNGRRRKDAVPVYVIGVHALKNVIDTRLRIATPQGGYKHFPADTPRGYFEEMTAERKIKGKWTRQGPNESWDLAVYCEVLRQRFRTERIDWNNPPAWAQTKPVGSAEASEPTHTAPKKPGGRRVRSKGIS